MSKKDTQKLRVLSSGPKYSPDKWKYAIGAGCYPYAINLFLDKFALVGEFIGKKCNEKVADDFLIEVLKEELEFFGYSAKEVETDSQVENGGFKIYVQREEHTGYYHFLRQDESGRWSHKFPGEKPTNLDSYGNEITDPDCMIEAPFKGWCFLLSKKSK